MNKSISQKRSFRHQYKHTYRHQCKCSRLSAVEAKLDEILSFLKNSGSTSSLNPVDVQDAIRAHIAGDRSLMDALRAPE